MVPGTNHKVMPVSEQLSMFEINEPGANRPFAVIVEIGPPGDLSDQQIYIRDVLSVHYNDRDYIVYTKDSVQRFNRGMVWRLTEWRAPAPGELRQPVTFRYPYSYTGGAAVPSMKG